MSAQTGDQAAIAAAVAGTGPRCGEQRQVGRTLMVCTRPPHVDRHRESHVFAGRAAAQ